MARIRTIKPEFWRHEDLSELPEATHLLAAALLNYADDEGYFNANAKLVIAECCPLRETSVSVQDSIKQLASVGYLRLGEGRDGRRYGHIVKFLEHQRINRPSPSKIKELDIMWEGSPQTHSQLTEPSHPEGNREQGKEGKGNARAARSSSKRVRNLDELVVDDELRAWALETAPDASPDTELENFILHCRKNGKTWKDYRAAFQSWLRKSQEFAERDGRAAPKVETLDDTERWPVVKENIRKKAVRNPADFREWIEPQVPISFGPLVLEGPEMPEDMQAKVRDWWGDDVVFKASTSALDIPDELKATA